MVLCKTVSISDLIPWRCAHAGTRGQNSHGKCPGRRCLWPSQPHQNQNRPKRQHYIRRYISPDNIFLVENIWAFLDLQYMEVISGRSNVLLKFSKICIWLPSAPRMMEIEDSPETLGNRQVSLLKTQHRDLLGSILDNLRIQKRTQDRKWDLHKSRLKQTVPGEPWYFAARGLQKMHFE